MSKGKKDKGAFEKRRQKNLARKKQKQKQKRKTPTMVQSDNTFRPGISEMDVNLPDGYRAVSNSQAVLEYSKPFMDDAGDDIEKLNRALTIGQLFWNYSLSIRLGTQREKAETETIDILVEAGFQGEKEELKGMLRE